MTYDRAIKYIHSIPKFSRVLGNDLLRVLLKKLGDPHKKLKFIHVGGTNGKGSTATMISEILQSAGYKTGLFTSPYLVRFNERIRLNGEPIGNVELAEIVGYIKEISEKYDAEVSEFAFITAAAMVYFLRENCDIVVLEVGLGGRLDATNVIEKSEATVMTSIGLDHCQYLGDTLYSISCEKLGIVKRGSPLVLYPKQDDIVFKNAKDTCIKLNSELIIPEFPTEYDKNNKSFNYKEEKYTLAMGGEFQALNAVTAIETAVKLLDIGYKINKNHIKHGLSSAKISGRLERIGNVLIDGAHNPQAVGVLLAELEGLREPIHFITAVMDDKDHSEITALISEFCEKHNSEVTATQLDMPRCLGSNKLAAEFARRGIAVKTAESPTAALGALKNFDGTICVCGSLYLAGEIKKLLT